MDTNSTDLLIKEADEAADPVSEIIDGLEHRLQETDLQPVTREMVTEHLEAYRHRMELIGNVSIFAGDLRRAVVALLQDGHPDLPILEVNGDVLEDLDDRLASDAAARATFKLRPVTETGTFEAVGEQHAP